MTKPFTLQGPLRPEWSGGADEWVRWSPEGVTGSPAAWTAIAIVAIRFQGRLLPGQPPTWTVPPDHLRDPFGFLGCARQVFQGDPMIIAGRLPRPEPLPDGAIP